MRALYKELFDVYQDPERRSDNDQSNNPPDDLLLRWKTKRSSQAFLTNFSAPDGEAYRLTIDPVSSLQPGPTRQKCLTSSIRLTRSTLLFRMSYTHLCFTTD
jgi:hypothetical protein